MRFIPKIISTAIAGAITSFLSAPAMAEDILEYPRQPVVVEMFVSQACGKCTPAAAYMTELADRDDVVALAWHVDYWDNSSARGKGRWKDIFAKRTFTERQRLYNKNLRGRGGVFTPQAVVNGNTSLVGSKRKKLDAHIAERQIAGPAPNIRFSADKNGLKIAIDNLVTEQNIYIVSFYRFDETAIPSGHNAGVTFTNANIVQDFMMVPSAAIAANPLTIAQPEPNKGCAVFVQEPNQGAITAAAYCPSI